MPNGREAMVDGQEGVAPGAGRWPWVVWLGSLLALAVAVVFEVMAVGSFDVGEAIFIIVAASSFATVGALITSRQRGNRVGLLFTWVGAWAAVAIAAGSYATLALERSLPFLSAAAWLGRVGFAAMFGPLAFLCLIFPTGEPPSRRWGWVLRVMLVAYAVNLIGLAFTPGPVDAGFSELEGNVQNPLGLPLAWREVVEVITGVAGLTVLAGGLLSIVSLVQRFRRASDVERQQIRWLLFLTAFLGALLTLTLTLQLIGLFPEDENSVIGNAIFFVFIIGLFIGIPAASAIAILRYRLYDLDLVVKKTVLYFVLVALIVVVASVGAFLLGSLVVAEDLSSGWLVLIGVVAGALLWPLRRLAIRISDRLVYGGRTTSYEAMTTFSHRVGESYSSEDVLPRMATILRETTRAAGATIWLRIGSAFVPAAWDGEIAPGDPVDAEGDVMPALPADHAAAVRHQGELLGALSVTMPANDPIGRGRERLVDDLAAQAGAVVRNVRLIQELRASRQRLVAAQDEERRKIERNIHDGAQQQLVALSVKLRLLHQLVDRDPAKAGALTSQLQDDATQALDDLRDLARGIYPPLLADKGLPAAIEAQARKSPLPVTVTPDGVGRHPQDVESALYFCCLEALQNVAKYARADRAEVRMSQDPHGVTVEVTDDGVGFDLQTITRGTGLQGMADRLDAIGGTLEITSTPGVGTTVVGRVPSGRGPEERREPVVASDR